MADNNVPAGWYPDAQNPSINRWWDGTQWTEHTQQTQQPVPQQAQPYGQQQYTPQNGQGTPTIPDPNNFNYNQQPQKPVNKGLIIGLASAAAVVIIAVIVVIAVVIGGATKSNEGLKLPSESQSPSSSSQPSESPSDEPSTGSGDVADPDPNTISPTEQRFADGSNAYFKKIGYGAKDDATIVKFGYSACSAVAGGMTKQTFTDFIQKNATSTTEAQAIGFMFGAGVATLCPQYTDTVSSWIK